MDIVENYSTHLALLLSCGNSRLKSPTIAGELKCYLAAWKFCRAFGYRERVIKSLHRQHCFMFLFAIIHATTSCTRDRKLSRTAK